MLSLEVLLATMYQENDELLSSISIDSDVIVCNQNNNFTDYKEYTKNGHRVRWYDFAEKGVGLNRNNALLRSTADICLLADDDTVLCEGYKDIILKAFEEVPKADVLLFNVDANGGEERYAASKIKRVRKYSCGKFGAVRVAFRRAAVIKNAITFNQLFGGGSMYSAGEDTMFLEECARKGLRLYTYPEQIVKLRNNRPSTWFCGYNDKFFHDMGASYYVHYKEFSSIIGVLQLVRHKTLFLQQYTFQKAFSCFERGKNEYKRMR